MVHGGISSERATCKSFIITNDRVKASCLHSVGQMMNSLARTLGREGECSSLCFGCLETSLIRTVSYLVVIVLQRSVAMFYI